MVAINAQELAHIRKWADKVLPGLIRDWEALPDELDDLKNWEPVEQMTYVEEWRHRESQRADLEKLATQGILASKQLELLDRLHHLVAEYEAKVDQILGVKR